MEYPHYNPASDNRPVSDEELDDLDELADEDWNEFTYGGADDEDA